MDPSPHFDGAAIKANAVAAGLEAGAGAVRVVPALADVRTRQAMVTAFARGDLRTWGYDQTYARSASDPAEVLPGAKSVVCIAVPYATPAAARPSLHGRVSNYAWSADYHRRVRRILQTISDCIDADAGARVTAIACDTRPLAERAFAARAGLGWVGKHTNVISPRFGSFVFLGEVVTAIELPPDEPVRKGCGACERCVVACPTRALRGDYTIDALRCISDLTQRIDGIPRSMRSLVGDWVWGCDVCQLVCPPTRQAPFASVEHKPLEEEMAMPSLVRLLALRSGEFKRRYARTAMGWRGAAVLRRNAAVALGNSLDRAAVAALARALHDDPHAQVRGHAAWALGRIGSPAAQRALQSRAALERDHSVQEEIAHALATFGAGQPLQRT